MTPSTAIGLCALSLAWWLASTGLFLLARRLPLLAFPLVVVTVCTLHAACFYRVKGAVV